MQKGASRNWRFSRASEQLGSMAKQSTTPAVTATVEKITYTAREACAALGIGRTSLWLYEKQGLISSVPGLRRRKLYAAEELKRFASGAAPAA